MTRRPAWMACLAALVMAAIAVTSADSNQKAFEKEWTGRRVLLKRPLFSLVYNERVHGSLKSGRDGLTVVTPFSGTYYQFDGRRRVDDVTEHDVEKIVSAVTVAYRKDRFNDEGWVQEIEPVLLTRYDKGVELIVRAARAERDIVRLELVRVGDEIEGLATSLTVKWPLMLSKGFTERGNIEDLIHQFLTVRE